MTAARTESIFQKVSELVTSIQKGTSDPRAIVYPKAGRHHFTVRTESAGADAISYSRGGLDQQADRVQQ